MLKILFFLWSDLNSTAFHRVSLLLSRCQTQLLLGPDSIKICIHRSISCTSESKLTDLYIFYVNIECRRCKLTITLHSSLNMTIGFSSSLLIALPMATRNKQKRLDHVRLYEQCTLFLYS